MPPRLTATTEDESRVMPSPARVRGEPAPRGLETRELSEDANSRGNDNCVVAGVNTNAAGVGVVVVVVVVVVGADVAVMSAVVVAVLLNKL